MDRPGGSGSGCYFACIGGGVNSEGRPSFIFGVGLEVGFNAGANLSVDKASTGWEFGVECSAFYLTLEMSTSGLSAGANILPAKVGCGLKGKYTW